MIDLNVMKNPLFYGEFFDKMTESIFFNIDEYNFSTLNQEFYLCQR